VPTFREIPAYPSLVLRAVSPPERSAGGLTAVPLTPVRSIPDPEVPAKARRRGPQSSKPDPHTLELERENRRLKKQLQRVQTIIDVPKTVSTLLGIPLKRPPRAGND
jgi:hypothetical protein